MFPDLLPAGASWGCARAPSGALGRLEGAALTVGGHDHLVAAIGSGVTTAVQVMDSCGTAEALVRAIPADATRDPAHGLPRGIATGWHALEDQYCLLAGLPLGIELTPLLARLGASHRRGRASLDDAALALLGGGVPSRRCRRPRASSWPRSRRPSCARPRRCADSRTSGARSRSCGSAGAGPPTRSCAGSRSTRSRIPCTPESSKREHEAQPCSPGRPPARSDRLTRFPHLHWPTNRRPTTPGPIRPAVCRCPTNRTRASCHEHRELARLSVSHRLVAIRPTGSAGSSPATGAR
jgi:hypothetical protein